MNRVDPGYLPPDIPPSQQVWAEDQVAFVAIHVKQLASDGTPFHNDFWVAKDGSYLVPLTLGYYTLYAQIDQVQRAIAEEVRKHERSH